MRGSGRNFARFVCKRRSTDAGLRLKYAILIKNKIRSPALRFIPAICRFKAEAKPQFKIRPQTQSVLRKSCGFE